MTLTARHGLLLLLLLASFAYHGARAYLSATALVDPGSSPTAPFSLQNGSPRVRSVAPEADAAGLQAGDTIVRVGSRKLRGHGDLAPAIADATPDGSLEVTVSRAAGEPAPGCGRDRSPDHDRGGRLRRVKAALGQ